MKSQQSWIRRAGRLLRHDLTLGALVACLVAVSAGVIAAARHDPSFLAENAARLVEAAVSLEPELPEEEPVAALPVAPPLEPETVHIISEGRLVAGDSLAGAMGREGVSPELVHLVARELRGHFDFRRAQPGHRFRLTQNPDGSLVEFRYYTSDTLHYAVRPEGDGYSAAREEAELRPQVSRLAGIVTSTLHEAVVALGEQGQLANDFSDIFAWDLDFSRSVQAGDEFSVLYERLYLVDDRGTEVYARPGRILAARYNGSAGEYSAIYFEPEEGRGGYYRPDGTSVRGQYLMAPLRYSRITSRYSPARRHPILKVTRPHHGIDYAAPHGTPLWAVADGKVTYRGWAGGFGNLVKIRHSNGFVSYYAHLSRFAKGLREGQSVQQKQVIGYVGQTGLATGPHVCFRVAKNGKYVNPTRMRTPAGPPVAAERRDLFQNARDVLFAELDTGTLVGTEQAL